MSSAESGDLDFEQLKAKIRAQAAAPAPAPAPVEPLDLNALQRLSASHRVRAKLAWYRDDPDAREDLGLRVEAWNCLLYTSPSPRDRQKSRMPSSA